QNEGSGIKDQGSGIVGGGAFDAPPTSEQASAAPCSDAATGDGGKRILRFAQNDRIEALRELFARTSLIVEKHSKKGDVEMDIAPMIREIHVGTSIACPPSAPADGQQNEGSEDTRTSDARPYGAQNDSGQNDKGETVVIEAVVAAQNPTLNPLLLVTAIEKYLPEHKPDFVQCRRLEIYDADMNVFR
ncbi:MAG: hypothetical protein IJM51_05850, partial [Clostridia bacterium]|nr:hypothetical protein [Clostridia bacterium]